jgi:hypothetical protein
MNEPTQLYQEALNKRDELNSRLVLKSWQDPAFHEKFLANPARTLGEETGQVIPAGINIHALAETGNKIYIVIPKKPALPKTEEALTEEALSQIAAGFGIVYKAGYTTYGTGSQAQPPVFLVWF